MSHSRIAVLQKALLKIFIGVTFKDCSAMSCTAVLNTVLNWTLLQVEFADLYFWVQRYGDMQNAMPM